MIGPWMWANIPTPVPSVPETPAQPVTLSTAQADMVARNKQILDLQKAAQAKAALPKCDLCGRTDTEIWMMNGPFPYPLCVDADDCDAYRWSIANPLEIR
jgi:hypothetical protein